MGISGGVFTLTPRGEGLGQRLSINIFMRSLAEERKNKAIGVVFSGTGADGTLGLEDIKAEGGITFAQDPASAKYDSMPRSAIDSGCVDFVLPPKVIAKELDRIHRHPYVSHDDIEAPEMESAPSATDDFTRILDQLRKTSGVDFSLYRPNTIHRRAMRRMAILKLDSFAEYTKYLNEHPEEGEKLYDDVLIPVTSFFRDFEAFDLLKDKVYPAIVKDKGNKGDIRMWAPGCSTGEETYSLAMTLLEFLGDKVRNFQIQLFGTDLNERGIQKARAGVYRESIAEEISPERMRRFFVKVNGGYRVDKSVRDLCVFARQNLASDPPFSQVDLVACRNLLIYIQPVLQKKIIPILHYALKPSGFLMLGSSESVAAFPELFATIDKKHKIYSKKPASYRLPYDFTQTYNPAGSGRGLRRESLKSQDSPAREIDLQAEADRMVLKNHAPVGVVINSAMEVVQSRGRTTPYLELAPGKVSLNVLKMARNGLGIELRTLISAAAKKDTPVKKDAVFFEANGHKRLLNLSVSPLGEKSPKGERFFLVLFEEAAAPEAPKVALRGGAKQSAENKDLSRRLKQELASSREALRSSIESEDALKEEFQSANEEILSANEELQSTNEELETSKEELQSSVEELKTLNDELNNRNSELAHLNSDLTNVLDTIRIPILFIGADLRLRRFTSTATDVFRLLPSDIGRPISDVRHSLELPDLPKLIQQAITNLTSTEREVQDSGGRWRSMEIRPYRTADNRIDGAIVALPDIDRLKHSEQYLKQIIENVPDSLLVLDASLKVLQANQTFCTEFHVSQDETTGQLLYRLGNGQWDIPRLRELLDEVLPKKTLVKDFMVEHDFPAIGRKTMLVSGRRVEDVAGGGPAMILLAIEDITERKQATDKLRASEERFRTLFELGPVAVYSCNESGVIQNFNHRAAELWGRTPATGDTDERFCGSFKLFRPDGSFMPHEQCPMAEVVNGKIQEARDQEVLIERPDGSQVTVVVNIRPLKNSDGEVTGAINCFYDITERKEAEGSLKELSSRIEQQARIFDTTLSSIADFAYTFDREGRFVYINQPLLDLWGLKLEDAAGKTFFELPYSEELAAKLQRQIQQVFTTGQSLTDETPYTNPAGSTGYYEYIFSPVIGASGAVELVAGSTREITKRKLSEAAMIKSEKLATAGRLAATMAHEINNPLQAVANLIALVAESPRLDAQDHEYMRMAGEELDRVTHLTRQSLSFYREAVSPATVNVKELLEGILHLYSKRIKAKQIIVTKRFRLNGTIQSYSGEIRQVFSTLLMNAIEAVPEGGHIALHVKATDGNDNSAIEGIQISLADNGVGIPAQNTERIFEPFFTTKGDQGTGLGLWVAREIVRRLGGSIRVRSSVHPGKCHTHFSIFLPNQTDNRKTTL